MSKKANLIHRLKAASTILIPLVLSSMERIETISNAMELRGFGKEKKRTWYSGKALTMNDYLVMAFVVIFCIGAMVVTFRDGSRFYNPFV